MPPVSPTLTWSFAALAVLLAVAFVLALDWSDLRAGASQKARRIHILATVLLTSAWMTLTFGLAASGRLTFEGRPPTMLLLFVVSLVLAVALGFSRIGARLAAALPLSLLVGFQSFRIIVELLIARAHREGQRLGRACAVGLAPLGDGRRRRARTRAPIPQAAHDCARARRTPLCPNRVRFFSLTLPEGWRRERMSA